MQIVATRRVDMRCACVACLFTVFRVHWQVFRAVMPGVLSASRKRTCGQDCLFTITQLLGVTDTKSQIYFETLPAEDVNTQIGVLLQYATEHLDMTYIDIFKGTNGLARATGGPEANLFKIKLSGPILVVSLSFKRTLVFDCS